MTNGMIVDRSVMTVDERGWSEMYSVVLCRQEARTCSSTHPIPQIPLRLDDAVLLLHDARIEGLANKEKARPPEPDFSARKIANATEE